MEYNEGCAVWRGSADGIGYTVRAGVDARLPVKLITVELERPAELTFVLHPAMNDFPPPENCIRWEESGDTRFFRFDYAGDFTDHVGFLTEIACGETRRLYLLGAYPTTGEATYRYIRAKIRSWEDAMSVFGAYAESVRKRLDRFTLMTGEAEFDRMVNRCLPYQTVYVRMFARTGFYQSSGAYGFRDQLQDSLGALLYDSSLCMQQILRCCAHQYAEGDVMHWWHNTQPLRGVRTRCSDDYLWLPYAAARYVGETDDWSILEKRLPYLKSNPLGPREVERYENPAHTDFSETVYMHCARAVEHALDRGFGKHGLPYIGSCDWNDGFSRLGLKGAGESVWLGFFLKLVLRSFLPIAERMGDRIGCEKYEAADRELSEALDASFNGSWYNRAYADDGRVIGAPQNAMCRIDLLPQAFAALAFGRTKKTLVALDNMNDRLYDREKRLMKLFDPPFDRPALSPGYIAGYVPGVRENGGQYTHAAVWAAMGQFAAGLYESGYRLLRELSPAVRWKEGLGDAYRLEPYALAGDVYANPQHNGRGGWSQYTGAAAWYLSVALRDFAGYHPHGDSFSMTPHLPESLSLLKLTITKDATRYDVVVKRGRGKIWMLDGKIVNNKFYYDKKKHFLEITVEN